MKTRLHQFLSSSGLFKTKKELLYAISCGDIKVNDEVITAPNYFFNPKTKDVYYRNKIVKPGKKMIYIMMNKPEGYLCSKLTLNDKKLGNKSVFELIKGLSMKEKNSLFCVGRLDLDTSGLLIITNDGELGRRLTSPEENIEKVYEVKLKRPLIDIDKAKIEQGISIPLEENGKVTHYTTKPCKIINKKPDLVLVKVTEGKKREIKKLFYAVGNKALSLKRLSIGSLELADLKEGEYKLTFKEDILNKI